MNKKIKQYSKYNHIPKKYRFDLDDILQGKTIEQLIDEYKIIFQKRIIIKDSKYNSIENYLEDIKLHEKLTLLEYKIHNYISNHISTNVVDPKFNKLSQEFNFLNQQLSDQFGSEINRFELHIEKIKLWKENTKLKSYKHHIENDILELKHKLSNEIEEYAQQEAFGSPSLTKIFSILTNSELDYGTIVSSKGKKYPLNPTNRIKFMQSNDSQLRKQAYKNYIQAFLKHKESLANILYQHFKTLTVHAKLRHYDSTVQMLTYNDKVSDQILQKLYSQVSVQKNILLKYKKFRAKFYKIKFNEKYNNWDSKRKLVNVKSEYSIEEAKKIVQKALAPFGKEYIEQINKALTENWIDFLPANSKRSGAYSIGSSYGIDKKYILMNFKGDLDSVETLAHELGHSMHSYFSDTRQDLINSNYPIFLAEIASIYNELMLFDYLLENSNNIKLKFQILENMIDGFVGTVLRQVEWSNYEYELYKAIEQGTAAPSFESLSKIYYQNSLKYSLNKNKKYSQENTFASIYVPHFYYDFYVYKYAIGQLSANYFFAKYKLEGVAVLNEYIDNFLSAGCSDDPINILKKSGIDLESDQFYNLGFKYLKNLIDQYVDLGKQIFKIKK
ncbi:oligoendopeptidase F [Mycoplasmopsis cricetuli]|uniref:oligoendopeptidase F n=1 Tax=Mycoplasmopsis cricetuli TaxID=171283 RepID=UPI00068650AE|nr:oligoendopeptidase F [Mycoplasmopsis cricetuli]